MIRLCAALLGSALAVCATLGASDAWRLHVIDGSSAGADGVRLADINDDQLLDIATGWEEGGKVRAYLNPGPEAAALAWPAVTVGSVPSPEDAVFVDLDGDGAADVLSSTEGDSKTLFAHWAPENPSLRLRPGAWRTEALEASRGRSWMFVLPAQIDGRAGIDLFVGSKGSDGVVGWLESPDEPRDLAAWRFHRLYDAGWVMSLIARDFDGDGDDDLFVTDRKGARRGALWLENPGADQASQPWPEHRIGAANLYEAMFAALEDLDGDGLEDAIVAGRPSSIYVHRRLSSDGESWRTSSFGLPQGVGTSKGVAIADIDLDGRLDVAFTCERAVDGLEGVMWISSDDSLFAGNRTPHSISGPDGIKFDRIELLDLDADGDLDLITCEEREGGSGLGVIWYENPTR